MKLSIKDFSNIGNLYILMWSVYILFSMTDTGPDIVRQLLLISCLGIAIYCFILVVRRGVKGYMKSLSLLFAMFLIYGLILIVSYSELRVAFQGQNQPTYWFLEEMGKSILPIFAFYYFSENGYYSKPILRIWVFVFLLLSIYIFMMKTSEAQFAMIDFSSEQRVNGYAYVIIAVLPGIALFEDKRVIQAAIMLVAIVFSIIGMKRGAIFVSSSCLIWYSLILMRKSSMWSKLLWIILAFLIVRYALELFGFMAENNEFFSNRLDATLEGSTSGRDRIAHSLWDYYLNHANILQQLFGSGAYATIRVSFNFAHNDWLEILICEGLFGIIMYVVYWYNAAKTVIRAKEHREAFLAIGLFVLIYFLKTFFSMSINDMSFMSTLFLGYYLSILKKEHIYKKESKTFRLIRTER